MHDDGDRRERRRRRRRIQDIQLLLVGTALAVIAAAVAGQATQDRKQAGDLKIVLDEKFDGHALNTAVWNTCHWWASDGCTISTNKELQWYTPEQVSLADGHLSLTAERRGVTGSDGRRYHYTSGMVTTGPPRKGAKARVEITYGRVEARVRFPSGIGLWSALWMLPSSTRSRPEIDIVEVLGNDPSEWIFHLHPEDRDQESPSHRITDHVLAGGWHDLAVDWRPGMLQWFVDGKEVWRVEGDLVPDEPMYLVANLAVGGVYPGPPSAETELPASLRIDRVRMWQLQE